MSVRLTKEQIIRLFCYCREGVGSVHRALFARWPELQAYYTAQKRADIRRLTEKLTVPHIAQDNRSVERILETMHSFWPETVFGLRTLWHKAARRWKSHWQLPDSVLHFIIMKLEALLSVLDQLDKPANESLIELRMGLCDCEFLIDFYCHGIPKLVKAQNIDHFEFPYRLTPVSIEELIPATNRRQEAMPIT